MKVASVAPRLCPTPLKIAAALVLACAPRRRPKCWRPPLAQQEAEKRYPLVCRMMSLCRRSTTHQEILAGEPPSGRLGVATLQEETRHLAQRRQCLFRPRLTAT